MTHTRSSARLAALALGLSLVMSCDTRLPTQPGNAADDFTRPTVRFTLSSGPGNTVDATVPVTVSVIASDDKGVSLIETTVRVGALVLNADSASIKPSALTATRVVPLNLFGLPNGTKVTIRSTVTDVGLNSRVDSLVVTITNTIDFTKPALVFITPKAGGKVNVGDSLFVTAHVTDNNGIKFVSFSAASPRGIPSLGTADTVIRYPLVTVPATGIFPNGVTDTTLTRFLKVAAPVDTLSDTLIVTGIVSDLAGNVDTTRVKVTMVRGPTVIVISPRVPPDSADRGSGLTVEIQATQKVGVASLGFRVQGAANWPTKLDDSTLFVLPSPLQTANAKKTILIPADAPVLSLITITPFAIDVNGEIGSSSPVTIAVRAGAPPAPLVTQTIAPRVELNDSITISASGNGINTVGFDWFDPNGVVTHVSQAIPLDPSTTPPSYPSRPTITLGLNLPSTMQGKKITVRSFAIDKSGRTGYSVRTGITIPQTTASLAFADSALVVFGRTYPLPGSRNGTIADLKVDTVSGNIFLSNINFGRLEVWKDALKGFDSTGVVVGSQPWGMAMSRTAPAHDTLFVANSGGTNLSRVYIGSAGPMHEDLNNRLLTRASYLFQISEIRDPSTSQIRLSTVQVFSFSDRPQYVEQSAAGRLYISTKPTIQAPLGTIRYVDPGTPSAFVPSPDERFILDFGNPSADPNQWVIANVDSLQVYHAPPNTTQSDQLMLCDHPSGTTNGSICGAPSAFGVNAACQNLRTAVPTSDVECRNNLDPISLGLTDTTFVASSGDGKWITFGEGHKSPVARNFLLNDDGSVVNRYTYASGALNIIDLMNNQSDQVFGVALDKTGKTLGVHGTETAFSFVTTPFTQRLQGKHATFATGAGIAFHPNADGTGTQASDRLAFVASANGTIEAIDIAYYDYVRGSLATKFNLYGPLRASLPFPSDAGKGILFKLFGLSTKGLVVIDVTTGDLLAGPP